MKHLKLVNGFISKIDDDDYLIFSRFKWRLNSDGYVVRYLKRGKWDYSSVLLHRQIFGEKCNGKIVDHINRDRSDNRRCNLRIVDQRINSLNSGVAKKKKTFTGVYFINKHKFKKWAVRIVINRKNLWFGCFNNPFKASEAYQNFRKEIIYGILHG